MSVTLTGTGGLFTRLGRIFFGIQSANVYSGTSAISGGELKPLGTTYTDILAQFASALQEDVTNLFPLIDGTRSSLSSIKQGLQQLAQTFVIDQVHADAVLVDKSIGGALTELIRQMVGSGTIYNPDNDVDAPTVSASVAAVTTNTGTGTVAASCVGGDGRNLEYVFAEVVELKITSGSDVGGTARSEAASIKGETPIGDKLAYNWPGGSGASVTITACDASLDNGAGGNILTNGDMDTFTVTDTPDNWSILVGAASTDIFKTTSVTYRTSTAALEFRGTGGSPLSSIAQTLNAASQVQIKPNTVYAFGAVAKKTAGAVAGALQFNLLDSTNTVLNDDAGTANTTTIANGTLTTSYAWQTGFFRTPKTIIPGTTVVKIRVRISTAITSGESIYVDDVQLVEATQLYDGGPYFALFAGDTNFLTGDQFNITIANNRAGLFQEWFDRVFDMKSLGLQLPSDSAGTETIADTLIA